MEGVRQSFRQNATASATSSISARALSGAFSTSARSSLRLSLVSKVFAQAEMLTSEGVSPSVLKGAKRRADMLTLQASGSDDADEQQEPQERGNDEADKPEHAHAEELDAALDEDPKHRRTDYEGSYEEG